MKKHLKKLSLSRETLHLLDGGSLQPAKGGGYVFTVDGTNCSNGCITIDCPANSKKPPCL